MSNGAPITKNGAMKLTPHVPKAVKEHAAKLRSRWRQIVTGNEKKRIRDYIRETQDEPKYVKFFDKIAFTIGVLNMGVCQYFILNRPDLFPMWYAIVVPIMMLSRYAYFKHLAMQYFLIDFCYFVVSSTLVNLLLLHHSPLVFKVLFIHGCGPLTLAIPVWRNSFVFHDYDKIVSVYVHILPCMLYYCMRWHGAGIQQLHHGPEAQLLSLSGQQQMCGSVACEPLRLLDYAVALAMYVFWQMIYLLKTEYLDKRKLDANPHLLTSLRYMSTDTKNPMARAILKLLRRVGMFRRDEEYDSKSVKTKLAFVGSQFLYTLVAFVPTSFMYHSANFHALYILLIIINSVYNGASFYIEVFSKRYTLHIEKMEEMHRIATEASSMAQEIEKLQHEQKKKWGDAKRSFADGIPVPAGFTATGNTTGNTTSAQSGGQPQSSALTDVYNSSSSGSITASGDTLVRSELSNNGSGTTQAAAVDDLSQIASLLKETSEDAWARMKEHAQQAQEFRRTYSGDFMAQYDEFLHDDDNSSNHSSNRESLSASGTAAVRADASSTTGVVVIDAAGTVAADLTTTAAAAEEAEDEDRGLLDVLSQNPELRRRCERALTIDR